MAVTISRTDDLAAVQRLGVACGLAPAMREDEIIVALWGAHDGERLVGAVVLERLKELDTVNWLAVDGVYRRCGIGSRLMLEAESEAERRGVRRLYVTARRPAFFLARGYRPVTGGTEHDILLGECPRCEQFGRTCEPQAMIRDLRETAPRHAARS